jgi:hypothetical protein
LVILLLGKMRRRMNKRKKKKSMQNSESISTHTRHVTLRRRFYEHQTKIKYTSTWVFDQVSFDIA